MTIPLNWREHMTEEEAGDISYIDHKINVHRLQASKYTATRETIRRRVRSRVMSKLRRERMREAAMTGFMSTLTDEQKKAALSHEGSDTHG